jgi:hypothetical protein
MRHLFTSHHVLFVGCGGTLDDPHFEALLKYANELNHGSPNRHVLLVAAERIAQAKQYPYVQTLSHGERDQLLPSLQHLFPSTLGNAGTFTGDVELFAAGTSWRGAGHSTVQAGRDAALTSRCEHLCCRYVDMSESTLRAGSCAWIANTLQRSPAEHPSNQAMQLYHTDDHPIHQILGVAVQQKEEFCRMNFSELAALMRDGVLTSMQGLLKEAQDWGQREGKVQRLLLYYHAVGSGNPLLSFCLFRVSLSHSASAVSSDEPLFQVFNLVGPLEAEEYLSDTAVEATLKDSEALPPYTGDRRDFVAISSYLQSARVDSEDFNVFSVPANKYFHSPRTMIKKCLVDSAHMSVHPLAF